MTTYSGNCSNYIDSADVSLLENLSQRVLNWLKVQAFKLEVSNERRQLLEMSDASLSDMGITRAQAEQEAKRIDLPSSRLEMPGKEAC